MTDREQIEKLLEACQGRRILVVGDVMLDRYISGSVDRISPEAPVPVVQVHRESVRPGGAANVAFNIQAIGGEALIAGLIGQSEDARDLLTLLSANHVDTSGIVSDHTWQTTVKTRVVADRQQVVRIDRDAPGPVSDEHREKFCERLKELIPRSEGIIIEDYGKGAVNQEVVNMVLSGAADAGVPVALDPKERHDLSFSRLELVTPNYREACAAAGVPAMPLGSDPLGSAELQRAAEILIKQWNCAFLMITLGPHGMYLASPGEAAELIPTQAREVFDVSGAGDTVVAVAALALATGADRRLAAKAANYAAGVVVGKLGTAPCSADELLASLT